MEQVRCLLNIFAKQSILPLIYTYSLFIFITFPLNASASAGSAEQPILVIGASFANGLTPFNDNLEAPLGGVAVGFGSYLSLGDAIIRNSTVSGFVINEAQAGATTFDRKPCLPDVCGPGEWMGYPEQLEKALKRVAVFDLTATPPQFLFNNAQSVVVSLANDCLHSDAFGIPQNDSEPCSTDDMGDYINRLIDVGQTVIENGLTPVFSIMPQYKDLDLPLAKELFGLKWVISEEEYNELRDRHYTGLLGGIPEAIIVDAWEGFEHIGDGLHPDPKSSEKAAQRIVQALHLN